LRFGIARRDFFGRWLLKPEKIGFLGGVVGAVQCIVT
jgi:hypothetical protein